MGGDNLITEAGGGLVVVNMEYRLGVFGFLPGTQVKEKGALNAGLRKFFASSKAFFSLVFPPDDS